MIFACLQFNTCDIVVLYRHRNIKTLLLLTIDMGHIFILEFILKYKSTLKFKHEDKIFQNDKELTYLYIRI